MSLKEAIIGGILLISAFLVGPIGANLGTWSSKTGALLGIGGAVIGFILWGIAHAVLIKKGIVHSVDPALRDQQKDKMAARR
jgi:hypothetical protein